MFTLCGKNLLTRNIIINDPLISVALKPTLTNRYCSTQTQSTQYKLIHSFQYANKMGNCKGLVWIKQTKTEECETFN